MRIQFRLINKNNLDGLYSTTVAHVTGNTTKLAIQAFELQWKNFFISGAIILAFMFGSFVSGFIIGDSKFKLGRSYGLVLLIESSALFMSFMLLKNEKIVGELFAAFACGAQNAITTMYSGAVVRTTHMTGIVTDIGVVLAHLCRPDVKAERWRLKVLVPLWFGFGFGGAIGKMFYRAIREYSLLVPCFVTGISAFIYLSSEVVQEAKLKMKAERKEEDRVRQGTNEQKQMTMKPRTTDIERVVPQKTTYIATSPNNEVTNNERVPLVERRPSLEEIELK